MKAHRRRAARGFTLIETLVAMTVAVVLGGLAASGFTRLLDARALGAQAGELMAALRFARSEAIRRGQAVAVCASDPGAPGTRCQTMRFGAVDWRAGWIVFADPLGGGQPAGGPILRVQQPLARTGGVAGTRSLMKFTPTGISTDAASHFLFMPRAGGAPAVMVCVSKQGRARRAPEGVCT